MKTAVVIRHVAYEGLGVLSRVLELDGYDIIYMDAGVSDFTRSICLEADVLMVLDGPLSVNDIVWYPFMVGELQLISQRLQNELPVFGLGLGAQLIAKALGASVYPLAEPETGWAAIHLAEADSVLEPLRGVPVLHWHRQTFSIPDGATLLAKTAQCSHQAFSWKNSLALQFHVELDMSKYEQWLIGHAVEIETMDKQTLARYRQDAELYGTRLMKQASFMFEKWLLSVSLRYTAV